MVVHIVFWRLHDTANGRSKHENALEMKRRFEALRGIIPGLLHLEFGIDFASTEQSSDVVLYTEFESRAALDDYQVHPAHKDVAAFLADLRSERRVVDYERWPAAPATHGDPEPFAGPASP
jgi:hypothetical protein